MNRIAHIIGKMCAGGVEAVVFNYYRAINHEKYQFDFFYDEDSTIEPPEDLISQGARFYKLPPYQNLPAYLMALRRYLRIGKYDVVHSHLNTLSVFPLYAAWREHVPVRIAHNHSVPGGKEAARNALKNTLRHFSKIFSNEYFACSEEAGRWLFGDRTFDLGKVTILKNAIDFSKFTIDEPVIKREKLNLNIPDDTFVVGHVGRFTPAKNHKKVISVFKAVRERVPEALLLLVGDGEERQNIMHWIKEYQINESVIMTGKVSNPQNYYPLMNVLILPSVFEGVPVTVIESQVAGVPCVISNVVNPDVAISDSCHYVDVNAESTEWADELLKASKKQVILNEHSKDYNIYEAVRMLELKYDDFFRG